MNYLYNIGIGKGKTLARRSVQPAICNICTDHLNPLYGILSLMWYSSYNAECLDYLNVKIFAQRWAQTETRNIYREQKDYALTFDASCPNAKDTLGKSGAISMSCAGQTRSMEHQSRWSTAAKKQHTACPNTPTRRYACWCHEEEER